MKKEASGKKAKWLWLVLGIVALLAVVGVVLALVLGGGNDKTAGGRPDLYWNVDKVENVDRDTGLSIRKPAEDGIYYVRFAHDGEQVEIPVADKKLVNYIDSLDLMSLTLDDNGYVVDILPVKDVASIIGESLYVQSVNGDTLIANSSIMMNGRKITIKLNEQTGVYNVSGKGEFVGEALDASKLNPMDTISAYGTFVAEDSEEESEVTHVFVLKKPAESKIYFRADQFYNSSKKETTREPDENGAYTIKWYCEGETVELKCKDKAMVSTIDSANYHWCHWGLEFDEEGYIIDILDSFLASRTLMQCERYDITEIDDDGNYTATSLIKNNGAFVQGTVGADCAIYDISSAAKSEGQDNRKVDKLQLGDRVCIWTDTMGNPVQIYVTARRVDVPAFWNITRSYSSTTMQTTRTPNDKGIYEIEMLKAGDTKKTVYYTDDIEIATAVDKTADLVVGMKVGEGNKIEYVYDIESLFGNTYFVRGYYILDATGTVCTYLTPSGSGATKNGVLAADAKVYNISTIGKYGAETTLQPGDYVYAGKTPTGEVAYAFVVRRVLKNGENMFYWRIDDRKYDSKNKVTTREKKDGYYTYLFAHEGQQVTLKTDNIEFATALDSQSSAPAFALEVKGDIITKVHEGTYAYGGTRFNGWTIDAINGKKIEVTSSTGSKGTWDISDAKIFNVSNSFSSHKGEKISSLKVGDVLANYRDINGTPKVIIVKTRRTNKMAWPVAPQTNRPKNEDGWYYVDLAVDGKIQTFKVKSENLMKAIDEYTSPFGIEVSGNQILYMSTTTYVEGVKGTGVTTVTVESASKSSAKILHTLGAADKVGTRETLSIASGAKIYDVTEEARVAGKLGSVTTLKKGDVIRTYKDADGNQLYIYVISRQTKDAYSYCAHCDKPVYWTPYVPSSNAGSNDAHYYLATDLLDMPSQIRVYSTSKDFEIVLDLNGNVASRTGGRLALIRYNDTLTIIDTSADKSGKLITKDSASNGGVFMISQDTKTYGEAGGPGILNIGCKVGDNLVYGGIITVDHNSTKFSSDGGLITNSGIVNLYNGVLLNGIAMSNEDGANGGAINNSGTFNMYGGEITGGKVQGWHTLEDGTKKEYTGAGGNIASSGTVNIYGGVIKNGLASRGGNVSVTDGTFTLHDGEIINGNANLAYGKSTDGRGGNIFSTGDVYIKGGVVSGGQTNNTYGGNIMSTGMADTLYIQGGTVSGGISTEDGKTVLDNIYLMYSNIEITGGEINGGEKTGTLIGCTGTNTGGYSTITIAGGTIKGNVNGGGNVTTFKDNAGQKYYTSDGKDINVYFREDGTAYTLNSKNKEVAFYPNYKAIINLKGGKVEGTVNAATTQQINVSGNPVIKELKIGDNLLNVSDMTDGANVCINIIGVFTKPGAGKYTAAFSTPYVDAGFYVANDNDALAVYHPDGHYADCAHCDKNVYWVEYKGKTDVNCHYELTNDLVLTGENKVPANVNATLDLKGHTITAAADNRVFYIEKGATLNVFDSSEAKTGLITGGRAPRGGNIYLSAGTFNLYSGTVAKGTAYGASYLDDDNVEKLDTNGRGGNIFGTDSSKVNLYGGKVIDGKTTHTTVYDTEKQKDVSGSTYGGNIMVTGTKAVLNIENDAVVSGGTAGAGKNIALMYSNANVKGGTVQIKSGENIYATGTSSGGKSTLAVSGGTISGGTINLGGGATETKDYKATLAISGGNIQSTLALNGSKISGVALAGNPVIKSMTLSGDLLVDLGALTDGASIAVSAPYGVFTKPVADKAAAEQAIADGVIVPINTYVDKITVNSNSELVFEAIYPTEYQTVRCEHCGQDVQFASWHGAPITESGHYYLPDNVDLGLQISVTSKQDVVIDLNGKKITAAEGKRAFFVDGAATLSIQDSVGTGEITGGNSNGGRGGNIYATGGNLHLYGGKIYGGTTNGNLDKDGNDVAVFNGAFTMNGNVQIGQTYDAGHALYLFNITKLNLVSGTVTGGMQIRVDNATLGDGMVIDAITIRSGMKLAAVGNLTLTNPIALTITNNAGDSLEGVFTAALSNAATAATYFKAANADQEIVVNSDGALKIKDAGSTEPDPGPGEPDPGPGTDPTGTYCEHCGQTVTTWEPWDGTTTATGHFYLSGTVTVNNGQISVGSGKDMVIDLRGQKIIASGNRAFFVGGGATLSIQDSVGGGEITGGTANGARGGNIYASGANVKLYGGWIHGGTAVADWNFEGHDVAVYNGGTLTVNGNVTIGDNYTTGHAVYVFDGASADLTKGTIIGGLYLRTMPSTKPVNLGSEMAIDTIVLRGSVLATVAARNSTEKIAINTINYSEGVASVGTSVFTDVLDNAATAATYFKAAETGYEVVVNTDNTLQIKAAGSGEPSQSNCPHCDGATWTAWDGVATNGHFYLTENVTLTDDIELAENDDLVIDLRGSTITAATGKRAFTIGENEHLSICDTTASATAWGKVIGSSLPADATDNYGGTIYITAGSFDLYSGEITGGSAIRGGNIYLATDGTMNIKGGKITAGTATGTTGSAASTSGRGGNIYQNSGTTTISGDAAIVGGQVFKSTGNSGRGGNIFINGGTVILKGQATVTGGRTDADGGNIFVNAATLKIQENAIISSGTATARANNVYVMYSTLEMSGGTIDAGEVTTGTSIYTNGTASGGAPILNITGGTINGGVVTLYGSEQAADPENNKEYVDYRPQVTISDATLNCELNVSRASKLEISGNTVIQKLTLADGYYITAVGALGTDASIKINKTEGVFTDVLANANDVVSFFDAVEDGYNAAVTTDGKLEIVEDTTGGNTPGGEPEPEIPTFDCAHCDGTVEWKAWDETTVVDNSIASGHYYLTAPVTVGETNIGIAADQDVVIELNGHTITASETSRAFYVYGTLSIQDSSAEKTGAIVGGTVSGANGGTIYVTTNATLNLYSGTIRGGSAQRGGNIYVGAGGTTFNMYGGTVTGGIADNNLGTGSNDGRGGNIFANGGNVNLEGGTISDGASIQGSSWSGNIHMNGGILTVKEGVVIENGTAKAGANLYLVGATLNMTGGQINGGVATDGRTVCITGTAAAGAGTMNISGGTFNGGKISMEGDVQQEDAANNKAYVDYRTNVNITGGTFDCQIDVNKAFENVINVSGAPVIKSIKLGEGILMNVGTLTEGAKIVVDAESGVFTTPFADATAAEAALPYFDAVAYNKTAKVSAETVNALEVVAACECGCKTPAAEIVWDDANAYFATRGEGYTSLSSADKKPRRQITESVHLKLSADLNIVDVFGTGVQFEIGTSTATSQVVIDLNGFTWSTEGTRALYVGADSELTIINTAENEGYVTSTGSTHAGGVINCENGILNLRSGTIKLVPGETNPVVNAGVIYLNGSAGNAVFNMYGGTVTGGVINKTTNANGYGGNIHVYFGTFNMYGGTISNGVANGTADLKSCGGNLVIRSAATANLYGGTISGGTADIGDSIYAQGTVHIAPEMVIDGEVYLMGANVNNYLANSLGSDAYIMQNVTFMLGADVTMADIYADPIQIHIGKKNDANVNVTIDLNGYTWTGNHRLYVEEGSTLNFKDSSENKTGVMQSTGFGTNAGRILTNYGTVNIYGGTFKMVEDETVLVNGGGLIYISKGELNLYDGTITGGKVVTNDTKEDGHAYGGNIYVYRGTFNIYGGTISDGSATGSEKFDAFGGNICMRYGTTLNIEGGTISGGVSTDSGSNICLGTKLDGTSGAVMNKTAGTIENEDTSVEVAAAVKPA